MNPKGALLALLLILITQAVGAADRLVLVTASDRPMPRLSGSELRQLFLGIPLARRAPAPVPLLNKTEPLVHEVFLQKVMFMSAPQYERQIIAQVFRHGGTRPRVYRRPEELVQALKATPGSVTYMRESMLQRFPHVRVIQPLNREG